MEAKPADFFIGVADLFAILLPGALLTFMAVETAAHYDWVARYTLGSIRHFREGSAEGWLAFAISSYLLGHLASLIGAFFLDPQHLKTKVRSHKVTHNGDRLFGLALHRRNETLKLRDDCTDTDNPTPYKWARMSLRLKNSGAMQEIDRLEADSKFFRSVTVVLVIFALGTVCEAISQQGTERGALLRGASRALVCFVFARLSFWRFSDLRWKAAEAAYLAAVTSESAPPVRPPA
jgi:hypothetical protein